MTFRNRRSPENSAGLQRWALGSYLASQRVFQTPLPSISKSLHGIITLAASHSPWCTAFFLLSWHLNSLLLQWALFNGVEALWAFPRQTPSHVLHLPFVYRKTLAKNTFNQRNGSMRPPSLEDCCTPIELSLLLHSPFSAGFLSNAQLNPSLVTLWLLYGFFLLWESSQCLDPRGLESSPFTPNST